MPHEPYSFFQIPEPYYNTLFEALPGNNILVQNDPPKFTILAATPTYLKQTGYTKEAMIGKGVFEAFPINTDPNYTAGNDILLSYQHVSEHKEPHILPVQRYDLQKEDGGFTEKFWRISNRPVFAPDGEVAYIIHTSEDITDQLKAEAIESKLRGMEVVNNLFMQTPIPVCLLKGKELIIELANEPTLQLWGKGKQVIGLPLEDAIPEVIGQGYAELIREVIETGISRQVYESPVTLIRNGKEEVLYINYVYEPYYEEDNTKAVGVLAIGNDVTDKVLAKTKVKESEAKYQALFDSMDQGFCVLKMIFDADGQPIDYRFLEANPVFEQQTGLKDAVGKTIRELVPNIESHWMQHYGNVVLTGEAVRFTEGSEAIGRWFDVYAFRIGEASSHNVALLFTDITQRRKAEEALRQSQGNLLNMILQSPIAMAIVKGPSFVVEIANERMYELWGRRKEELLNQSIFTGLPEAKGQGFEALLTEVYTTGKTFSAFGIPVNLPRSESVETVYVNLLYEAFKETDGTISGIMVVATDVTEQVLATQKIEEVVAERTKELARANKELKRSNQNLEEFAHAASHDLKEPVRKIRFFTNHLKEHLNIHLQESHVRAFNRIENATERMGNLIDDLLLYSHVSERPHEMESIDLNQKLQRVLEDLELDIEEKKAVIDIENLPVVKGHRRQMQQLFQNIISNALKYSKANVPPHIEISTRKVTEYGKPYDLIAVKDNGIGFEQEYADKIFHMFTRLHGKAEYSGTGIGLSIVKKVVENHNGFIKVESTPGQGSTFSIFLAAE